MSNGRAPASVTDRGRPARSRWTTAFDIVRRTYAILLIALIVWVSSGAIRYLIRSLTSPTRSPAQISQFPRRLDGATLTRLRPDWLGLNAVANPRTPLEHYHQIAGWPLPDSRNDCTRSGCHAPMPHSRDKEVRAFLNMHASAIHCGVCHIQTDTVPIPVAWYNPETGRLRPPPALLQAFEWLTNASRMDPSTRLTRDDQSEIISLLKTAAREARNEHGVLQLLERFQSTRINTREFRKVLDDARTALPAYFRGDYGAKLAQLDASRAHPVLGYSGTEAAIQEYLRSGNDASGERRKELIKSIHPSKREPTLNCTQCHSSTGSLIDFAAAGYPEARLKTLRGALIFEMIEHIARGEPFYLPNVMRSLP